MDIESICGAALCSTFSLSWHEGSCKEGGRESKCKGTAWSQLSLNLLLGMVAHMDSHCLSFQLCTILLLVKTWYLLCSYSSPPSSPFSLFSLSSSPPLPLLFFLFGEPKNWAQALLHARQVSWPFKDSYFILRQGLIKFPRLISNFWPSLWAAGITGLCHWVLHNTILTCYISGM